TQLPHKILRVVADDCAHTATVNGGGLTVHFAADGTEMWRTSNPSFDVIASGGGGDTWCASFEFPPPTVSTLDRISSSGTLDFTRTFTGSQTMPNGIVLTSSGGIALAGAFTSASIDFGLGPLVGSGSGQDAWFVRYATR